MNISGWAWVGRKHEGRPVMWETHEVRQQASPFLPSPHQLEQPSASSLKPMPARSHHAEQPLVSTPVRSSPHWLSPARTMTLRQLDRAYRRQLEDLIPSQLEPPTPLEDPTPTRKHHTSLKNPMPVYAGLNDATCSAMCSLATNKMPRRCFTHTPPRPFP
jgi:hypothetical protein